MSAAGLEFHHLLKLGACNQWLIRPESALRCSHPSAYHFYPVHWAVVGKSLLDAYFKAGQHSCVQWTWLPTKGLVAFGQHGLP